MGWNGIPSGLELDSLVNWGQWARAGELELELELDSISGKLCAIRNQLKGEKVQWGGGTNN